MQNSTALVIIKIKEVTITAGNICADGEKWGRIQYLGVIMLSFVLSLSRKFFNFSYILSAFLRFSIIISSRPISPFLTVEKIFMFPKLYFFSNGPLFKIIPFVFLVWIIFKLWLIIPSFDYIVFFPILYIFCFLIKRPHGG